MHQMCEQTHGRYGDTWDQNVCVLQSLCRGTIARRASASILARASS